ncbi:MAG: hypothetical protein ACE5FN_08825 [Leptospirillia bacterium]
MTKGMTASKVRKLGLRVVMTTLAACMFTLTGCAHTGGGLTAAHVPAPTVAPAATGPSGMAELAENFGIELLTLRLTSGGHLVDLRYKVVDPEQASKVMRVASDVPIYLVDKTSGGVAEIPNTMLGKLKVKTAKSRMDRIYYVLFKNPDLAITAGGDVEVHIGDVVVDGWPVR